MSDEQLALGGRGLVVAEKPGRVNLLWGFLTVIFALVLVRGHLGAETLAGRLFVDVLFGTLTVVSLAAWTWFRRHRARLEIAHDTIAFSHRGQPNAVELHRSSGDLHVQRSYVGGKHPLDFLKVTGSDEAIPLQMFDRREVEEACRGSGWRFVGDEARGA